MSNIAKPSTLPESQWKLFKKVREAALERFSEHILADMKAVCDDITLTAHERYLKLHKVLEDRDRTMTLVFREFSRSTAVISLHAMHLRNLVTEDEVDRFDADIQRMVRNRCPAR